MSPDTVVNVALAIVMAIGAILFRSYVREQDSYRKEVDRRFDDAGRESSDLASDVQSLMLLKLEVARHDEQIKDLQRSRDYDRRQRGRGGD